MSTPIIINNIAPRTQSIVTQAGQVIFDTSWTADYETDVYVFKRHQNELANDQLQQLEPHQYHVTFVGAERIVRIELIGITTEVDDIITIARFTPATRMNGYENLAFTPEMLNSDFGRAILIEQQNRMWTEIIGPQYNINDEINPDADAKVQILPPNHVWMKNATNTAIIAVPYSGGGGGGGGAPVNATYILLTESSELPNSVPLSQQAAGMIVNNPAGTGILVRVLTPVANQTTVTNGDGVSGNPTVGIAPNPIIPGTAGMGIPSGDNSQRVIPDSPNVSLRYNTENFWIEYYDHQLSQWTPLDHSGAQMFLSLFGGTMQGDIDMSNNRINGLPIPVSPTEVASKAYVDGIAFNHIGACNYGTTANLAGYVYDNGVSGVGATLTAGSNGAFTTDSETPAVNSRILVKNQTNPEENGIYVLTQTGDVSTPAILTRAPDYDQVSEIRAGGTVVIISGDTLMATYWMMSQTDAITIGTTPITWQEVSAAGTAHPGGSSGAMQYNQGGLFGGDDNITTDGSGNQEIDGSLTVDDVHIDGNIITSNLTNGDVNIQGAGTGNARIHGIAYPKADGPANAVMQTDGSGQLSLNPLGDLKGLTLVQTIVASANTTSITMTNLPSNRYMVLYFDNFKPTTNNVALILLFSVDNGASWITGASYSMEALFLSRNLSTVSSSHMSNGRLALCTNHINTDSSAGKIELFRPNNTISMQVMSKIFYTRVGFEISQYHTMGCVTSLAGASPPINAIRLMFVAPALIQAGGRVDLYAV